MAAGFTIGPQGVSGFFHIEISRIVIICFLIFFTYVTFLDFVFSASKFEPEGRTDLEFPAAILTRWVARYRGWILLALR